MIKRCEQSVDDLARQVGPGGIVNQHALHTLAFEVFERGTRRYGKPTFGLDTTLVGGHDFFANPRLDPTGTRLAWICWDRPEMPWDGTWLIVADIAPDYGARRELERMREPRMLASVGRDRYGREQFLAPAAARAWLRLQRSARADGVALELVSAFRSAAYQAACDLVFKGLAQPSGYTEPLLHAWRLKVKAK